MCFPWVVDWSEGVIGGLVCLYVSVLIIRIIRTIMFRVVCCGGRGFDLPHYAGVCEVV